MGECQLLPRGRHPRGWPHGARCRSSAAGRRLEHRMVPRSHGHRLARLRHRLDEPRPLGCRRNPRRREGAGADGRAPGRARALDRRALASSICSAAGPARVNTSAFSGTPPACASSPPTTPGRSTPAPAGPRSRARAGSRPGRHGYFAPAHGPGAGFHAIVVHLKSGATEAAAAERAQALGRLAEAEVRGLARLASASALGLRQETTAPACTEYYRGKGGRLDHVLASRAMGTIEPEGARVSGYCAGGELCPHFALARRRASRRLREPLRPLPRRRRDRGRHAEPGKELARYRFKSNYRSSIGVGKVALPALRTVRAVLPHTALQSLVSSSGVLARAKAA